MNLTLLFTRHVKLCCCGQVGRHTSARRSVTSTTNPGPRPPPPARIPCTCAAKPPLRFRFLDMAGACWEAAHAHLQAPKLGLDVVAKPAGRRVKQHAPAVRPHARLGVPPRQRGQQLRVPPGQRGRRGRVHAARQRRQFWRHGRFQARQLCSCPAVRLTSSRVESQTDPMPCLPCRQADGPPQPATRCMAAEAINGSTEYVHTFLPVNTFPKTPASLSHAQRRWQRIMQLPVHTGDQHEWSSAPEYAAVPTGRCPPRLSRARSAQTPSPAASAAAQGAGASRR